MSTYFPNLNKNTFQQHKERYMYKKISLKIKENNEKIKNQQIKAILFKKFLLTNRYKKKF